MNGSRRRGTSCWSASPVRLRSNWETWCSSETYAWARVVESVKAASDIYAPIAGEVVAFNESLNDSPDLINGDPYGTWIFKLKPNNAADVDGLLDATGYQAVADAS